MYVSSLNCFIKHFINILNGDVIPLCFVVLNHKKITYKLSEIRMPGRQLNYFFDSRITDFITDLVPSLFRYLKGRCFLIPNSNDTFFLIDGNAVFYLKKRCLSCFHFRLKNGCGIGSDSKSICLIPTERNQGWSNIKKEGKSLQLLTMQTLQ